MAEPRRQGLSITLPRNFAYSTPNGVPPKTPDQAFSDLSLPAPPHHSTCRFRRPRLDALTSSATHDGTLPTMFASDIPIPSIEIAPSSDPFGPTPSSHNRAPSNGDRFRLSARRTFLPPRTPPAQIPTTPMEPNLQGGWDIKRPDSSCSIRSDSSVESDGSFVSKSFGGSCTSPESDFQDPFYARGGPHYLESPSKLGRSIATGRSDSSIAKTRWSPEMDAHLWNIYQMYLQDPTITPFKTVPGSLPPLGVCHRVAREAKRTWPRASRSAIAERFTFGSPIMMRDDTPELGSPRSGSSTPTGIQEMSQPKTPWPKESSTRRRLKELCKRKFSIAPHYQRLLQSRSPSPFLENFVRKPSVSRSSTIPPEDSSASFATRDLGVSLMSESAGPLAQLATETPQQPASDEWFNRPITTDKTMEMSISPQLEPAPLSARLEPPSSVPRLASPFTYNTWGPTRSSRRPQRPAMYQFDTMHATGPHLLSPARLDPFTNAHKRRAQNQLDQELSPGGSDMQKSLQDMFGPSKGEIRGDSSSRRVRVRNRGFTLGAVDARERLGNLFTPPDDTPMSGIPSLPNSSSPATGLFPPANEEAKRLGSPFELDAKKSYRSQTRTPRHAASTSESFITNPFANSLSIGERLANFQSMQQPAGATNVPLNSDEAGLSDAERIRRQLLNRQHGF